MAFKFRLETSLRLASQEMDIVQGELARELRTLQIVQEQRDYQNLVLARAIEGQKKACLEAPQRLSQWQRYGLEQKEKLSENEQKVKEQEKIVKQYREKLVECRIKVEKFKRLKEKKLRLYAIEELKKEQTIIDEIAQSRTGWR